MALSTFWYIPFALLGRFDAVWCVKPYPSLLPACWIQKCLGAKIVFDVDDLDWAYSGGTFRSLHKFLQTPWPRWGAFTTYHNPKLKDALLNDFHLTPDQLVRVPQGVDPALFHPEKTNRSSLPGFNRLGPNIKPLFVFTAHLNVACDLGEILKAFKLITVQHPKAGLIVAGGGPDQEHFEQEAERLGLSKNTAFTDLIPPQTVADYLRVADRVLVYYQNNEANRHRASLKAREAISCGCRVVATEVGDYREWGAWAYLSKPDPTSYARTVERSLSSRRKIPKPPQSWQWASCVAKLEQRLLKS
jgi:glycosyltransferase involved in cell wall biosynthesis